MMRHLLVFLMAFIPLCLSAQTTSEVRYIEVKGLAQMEVEPDEIVLIIGIEEYWKEEFEKRKEPKDYRTKVPLAEIEDALIKSLRKAGIEKEMIRVKNIGNYWRQPGKEFLFSKQLEVKVSDFSKINQLSGLLDSRGIKYMNFGELSHSNFDHYRKQVKVNALKDAREKAAYLVESLGEELGEVLSVTEVNDWYVRPMMAKDMRMSAEAAPESVDQIQNLTISYEVMAKFRIK
jgi:uncharacterized protein